MKYNLHFDFIYLFFGFLLTFIFIILKVTHFINWGWIWVFSPLWISIITTTIAFSIVFLICYLINKSVYKKRKSK